MADQPREWEQQDLLQVLALQTQAPPPEPLQETLPQQEQSMQAQAAEQPVLPPSAQSASPAPIADPEAPSAQPPSNQPPAAEEFSPLPPTAAAPTSPEPPAPVQEALADPPVVTPPHTLAPAAADAPATESTATDNHHPPPVRLEAAVPQLLLVLDTETTALSPAEGVCIEVGAVLFHVPSRSVLTQVSFLLPCDSNPAQPINGIAAEVTRLPQPLPEAMALFQAMADQADAVLAHNTAFDRQWFGVGSLPPLNQPWICSMEDIRWPADLQLRATPSVRDLALAHGVPVWAAHRALTDCLYLVHVLQRCRNLEPLLLAALEPRCLYRAVVNYDARQLAKDAGFRWNQPIPSAWTRRLSEREVQALPFAVERVDPPRGVMPAAAAVGGSQRRPRRQTAGTLPASA